MRTKNHIFLAFMALSLFLLSAAVAWANKSETKIEAPESAARGSEITIRISVTHSSNSFLHYTDWLWVQVNGKEIAKWEYSGSNRPEGATFTKEIKHRVDGNLEIKAKANCNLHGSANEAVMKVTVKE